MRTLKLEGVTDNEPNDEEMMMLLLMIMMLMMKCVVRMKMLDKIW